MAASENEAEKTTNLRASCVSIDERAVLIFGASGAGKSALALELISLGGCLVSDDITTVKQRDGQLVAMAPTRMRGVIEARFVGLLKVPVCGVAQVTLAVDLDQQETARLPDQKRTKRILESDVRSIFAINGRYLPSAIVQILRNGWYDDSGYD